MTLDELRAMCEDRTPTTDAVDILTRWIYRHHFGGDPARLPEMLESLEETRREMEREDRIEMDKETP